MSTLRCVVGQLCKFIVNTSKAGCSALAVNISGPSRVELMSREVEEGYEFSYTPLSPGDYLISVKYAGTHVPGSPFNAHIEGAFFTALSYILEVIQSCHLAHDGLILHGLPTIFLNVLTCSHIIS